MDRRDEFMTLFLQHRDSLNAFILASVADRQTADDIFQDVALALWQSFERYDATRPFAPWARGVAANRILKAAGAKAPAALSAEAIESVAAAYDRTEAAATQEAEALRFCLEKLPDKSRALLAQRYEHARKLAELAQEHGSTVDAVNKSLSRIRAALQKCVEARLKSNA